VEFGLRLAKLREDYPMSSILPVHKIQMIKNSKQLPDAIMPSLSELMQCSLKSFIIHWYKFYLGSILSKRLH
jgi:hypothetical protein